MTLNQLSQALAQGKLSSVELTQSYLQRIEKLNPTLNALITYDAERSLAQARAADQRRARGEAGALTGIPIVHKDLFLAKGWRTTCGSKILHNFIAPYDAHIVEQLDRAGMVNLGKTNMDEFAMGSSNENSFFGAVKNPWRPTHVPGGSSGGSAAAVAAELAPAATATDTGGSIRQPAMYCGVCGLKPTYGLVSRYGMVAFASSLDQAGPLARTAQDCGLLLNILAGHDARDATSLARPTEDYLRDLYTPLRGLKIGIAKEYFSEGVTAAIRQAVEAALNELRKLGAQTVSIDLPNSTLCIPVYYVIASAEASSNLSRFDGVRYGYRAPEYTDLLDLYRKTRAQGFGAEVKRRIMIGTYVLSAGYYDAYYLKAQQVRRLIADDYQRAFRTVDVIIGPTAPSTAFKLGDKIEDPLQMYLNDIFTVGVNLAGLPAMSIPCGFDEQELPIGLHLIGNYFAEAKILNIAHQYQLATDWHQRDARL